jgi:hypothetical protein
MVNIAVRLITEVNLSFRRVDVQAGGMRWIALLLAVPMLEGPAVALGPVLPDFLSADTKVVIGIQLRHLLDSPYIKGLALNATSLPQTKFGSLDILKDVDEVLVATDAGENASALLVLKGRFGSPSVQEDPAHAHMLLAILDSTTAIAGDAALVRAAMAKRGKGSPPLPEMEARIGELMSHYDIWGIGDHVPKTKQAGQMDSIDGFSFGAALQKGLDLTGSVHLRTAADVQKLNAMLAPIQAMLTAQKSASKFDAHMEGSTLRVSLFVPEEELKKGIEAQKQAFISGFTSALQRQTAPPKPKEEGKILTDARGDTVSVKLPGGR